MLLLGALLLSACGGGGAGLITGAAPPAPTPVPVPPPTPGNYDSAEYRRSNAAISAQVLGVWNSGWTGAGVTIADIDSGVNNNSPEFAGRLHPASRDVTGAGRAITDESGHGTSVAAVMVAARNDSNIQGVAPGATLLALRADRAGGCTADGCSYTDTAISAGIDAAVAAGARVINLSLGGSGGNSQLRGAFQRAAAAGVVLVVAAGNDGLGVIDDLPAAALASAGGANVIVVGATDGGGAITDFSNRAGPAAANFITALGSRVRSFDEQGVGYLYSGTSYSAPAVSAAAALLAEAYPSLTGAQIVSLLLRTADDAGVPGTDGVYGRGRLNIAAAFAPAGGTSLAGSAIPVAMTASGSLGSALGDGLSLGGGLAAVPVVDGYGRAYALNLGASLRPAGVGRLAGALLAPESDLAGTELLRSTAFRDLSAGVAIITRHAGGDPALGLAQAGFDAHAARRPDASLLHLSMGGTRLVAAQGFAAGAFLPGGSARAMLASDDGLADGRGAGAPLSAFVLSQQQGAWTWAVAAHRSRAQLTPMLGLRALADTRLLTLGAARAVGSASLALHLSQGSEDGALLGTRLNPAFGLAGARSLAAGAAFTLPVGPVQLRLAGRQARVTPQLTPGLLAAGGAIRARSWSAEVSGDTRWGSLTLRLAQPLRVESGSLRLDVPGEGARMLLLAPHGRERALELGWSGTAGAWRADLNLFNRFQPGHQTAQPADRGGALRISRGF
ncbi:S8 family serine peptidase [Sandaracinobacteroides saxicola]|uniref:S8 family serine peptidase n=1 Tax=Sandaracinobacteroides saxicola TaxID=2759707 RepID=A0A7G5IFU9_9SPHN|nr:S8 family serine peptidase [Sandaracinobacteroides saxicola]QMW22241.1 S8 family serine peptidase [Sandaracinobacteroides saxicola]